MINAYLLNNGSVMLETDHFKAVINPIVQSGLARPNNFFGCSTYVETPQGWLAAFNLSYLFLKCAHKDLHYVGQLWPHAADMAANGGRWKDRGYGTRNVDGINEAICSATWLCKHPVSDQNNALGFDVEMRTEWVVREGGSRVFRFDTMTVNQDIYDIQVNHFAGLDDQTALLQGLVKTYVDDCNTSKTWTFQAGLDGGRAQYTADRMVGTASTKLTVNAAAGNTGKIVYQTLSSENWTDYHHYGYWVRTRDGDTENAIRWYIIDATGGKQYLGQPVSLTKDYILNAGRTAHDYKGQWRQVYVDLTGIIRGSITHWGFEILTDALIDFLLDDVFRYAWQEYDQRTTIENIVYPTITYPSTFRDEVAFPEAPLKADFTKLTHLPFGIHFTTGDRRRVSAIVDGYLLPGWFYSKGMPTVDNYWAGSYIQWDLGTCYDGGIGLVLVNYSDVEKTLYVTTPLAKYWKDPNHHIDAPVWADDGALISRTLTSGTLASAIMVKSKYSVQWVRIRGVDPDTQEQFVVAGTRAIGRVRDLELKTYTFEAAYCSEYADNRTAGRESLLAFYAAWDAPEFINKTIADLPEVCTLQKLIQSNPKDRYETNLWTRDLITRLRETKTGYVAPAATPGIVMYRYNDAWLKNTPWDTTMTDNRVDYLQFWCDIIKTDQGLPVVAESTAAVPEGYLEIPHYNTAHIATLENGALFRIFFWIYADVDGYYILRDKGYGDDQASYYDPIVEDGRTYYLSYTYPLSGTCLASAYGTEAEFGQPTIRDFRLNQLQHIIDNYNVDAVALSEDCTFYHHGSYGAADLQSYNTWRVNVAGLAPVSEFPRQTPGAPLSNSNLVLLDNPILWDWKCWLVKRFMSDVTAICHARGVLVIVDVNLETTLRTYDRYNTVYNQDPANFAQDSGGNWYTRDFSNYSRRYGVDIRDVMDAADLAYTWMYGNFSPWGFWQNFLDYTAFLNGKGFEGRVLHGPGLYPDNNPPTAEEVEASIYLCAQYGYGAVVPASKQWGSYSVDQLWHIDRGMQTICDFSLSAGVLTCPYNRGIYFPKTIGGITLAVPGGSNVKHYSKTRVLNATYAPYSGQTIAITAGDSLLIITGAIPNVVDKPLPYLSPYTTGIGMLSDIIQKLCTNSGLQPTDIDTSALAAVNVYGYVFDGGSAGDSIAMLQSVFLFDIVEKTGKLAFLPRPRAIVATISYDNLVPLDDNNLLSISRINAFDLPREINIEYLDASRNYQTNSQRSTLQNTGSEKVVSVKLPIALDSNYARQAAEIIHQEAWCYRTKYSFKLPLTYRNILPGDSVNLVNLQGETVAVRILSRSVGDFIQFDGVKDIAALNSTAIGGGGGNPGDGIIVSPLPSTINPFPAPLIETTAANTPGVFYTLGGNSNPKAYPGAAIYYSTDDIDYTYAASTTIHSSYGTAQTVLADCTETDTLDLKNQVVVSVLSGALSSISYAQLINGGNPAMLGGEVIQYQTATQLTGTTWKLSNLLRGRRGTEYLTADHAIGERFIPLNAANIGFITLPTELIGVPLYFKSVTKGTLIGDATASIFTPACEHLKPFSVCNIRGYRRVNHDVVLSWNRRTRLKGGWNNYADVALDFAVEQYKIQIYDGMTTEVMYTFYTATPALIWDSSSQQDWYGAGVYAPSPFKVRIYQMSDIIGQGQAAIGIIS